MFCYMLQFLDKSSLSYASIMGISKDTVCGSSVVTRGLLTFLRVFMVMNFHGLIQSSTSDT